MNARALAICVLTATGVALLSAAFVQQRQLTDLRAEDNRLTTQAVSQVRSRSADAQPGSLKNPTVSGSEHPSPELLELRSKVTQLTQRKRQLESVRAENERLRSQLAARTNNAGQAVLPPGYIRKSQAQWVGLSTPENTIQSFLWAVQNRDLTHLLRTLTPNFAEQMMRGVTNAPQQVFQHGLSVLPGLHLLKQQSFPDGSIRAQVEFIPGQPMGWWRFEQVNGEWKIDLMD